MAAPLAVDGGGRIVWRGARQPLVLGDAMAAWLHGAALLAAAALFGGMGLFAGGFAAFVFTALPLQEARALIRRAFPPFYLWVIFTAAIAAGAAWPVDRAACAVLAAIAVSTVPTRQMLMPAINDATDSGRRRSTMVP